MKSQELLSPACSAELYLQSMELKDWIKAARTGAGMTMERLGFEIGRSKANVSGWEKGLHEPSWGQIVDIARTTGFPLWKLDESMLGPADSTGDGFRRLAYEAIQAWDADGEPAKTAQRQFLAGFVAAVEAELAKRAAISALTVKNATPTDGGGVGKSGADPSTTENASTDKGVSNDSSSTAARRVYPS